MLVPVLNEERYIEYSVAAMRRQQFDGSLEFVFADGGSTDRTRELLERMAADDPRIRIFDNPKGSVSSGLNIALRHSRGHWVARMDAHTEYPEDYIALGVQRLGRSGTRWVSGPPVPRGDNTVSRAVALALSSPLGRGGSRKWGSPGGSPDEPEVELDSGVFAGVWLRATVLEYGGWDEHWPRNSDSEMAARFLAGGERLICVPAMAAAYVPRGSLRGLWRQYHDYGIYRERTASRHPHSLRRSHLLAPALVLDVVVAALAPRRLRALARAGLGVYVLVVVGAGLRQLPTAGRDALLVPVVLPIMHLGHGLGFIEGALRDGPPLAALASVTGLSPPNRSGQQEPVFNPSLTDPEL